MLQVETHTLILPPFQSCILSYSLYSKRVFQSTETPVKKEFAVSCENFEMSRYAILEIWVGGMPKKDVSKVPKN